MNSDLSYFADEIRSLSSSNQLCIIVGSGVSLGATNSKTATWRGFIEEGANRCIYVAKPLPDGWHGRILGELASGDLDEMLSAAEKVSSRLKAPSGGEFKRWLRESVGSLNIVNDEVLSILREIDSLFATTNYDSLLEQATGLPPVTWMDSSQVERVIAGHEQGILHLHGHWEQPQSVILGIRSYDRIVADEHAQTVLKSLRTTKRFLFIGCGDGLTDPNIGAFLRWSREVFRGSEYRHFLLTKEDEVAKLQEQHPNDERIIVLSYGDNHAALAPCLRNLFLSSEGTKKTGASKANIQHKFGSLYQWVIGLQEEANRLHAPLDLPIELRRSSLGSLLISEGMSSNAALSIVRLAELVKLYNALPQGVGAISARNIFVEENGVKSLIDNVAANLREMIR